MTEQDNNARNIRLGIGIVLLAFAIFDVIQGHPSDPSARWIWLSAWGAGIANGWGYTVIKAVAGAGFLSWALMSKR
jgi:hypothetical protein